MPRAWGALHERNACDPVEQLARVTSSVAVRLRVRKSAAWKCCSAWLFGM